MKKIGHELLFTSIPIMAVLLIGVGTLNTHNFNNSDSYEGVDQDKNGLFSEVVVPMSCTYRGKLKFDTASLNRLKRFQRVLDNN
jgi:hypothetical protein